MKEFTVYVSERLIHTYIVEAESLEALEEEVYELIEDAPRSTKCLAYEVLPEHTKEGGD